MRHSAVFDIERVQPHGKCPCRCREQLRLQGKMLKQELLVDFLAATYKTETDLKVPKDLY
jgi:hypothetical protein